MPSTAPQTQVRRHAARVLVRLGALVAVAVAPAGAEAHRLTFDGAMDGYVQRVAARTAQAPQYPGPATATARRSSCRATAPQKAVHRHRARCVFSFRLSGPADGGDAPSYASNCTGTVTIKTSPAASSRLVVVARRLSCRATPALTTTTPRPTLSPATPPAPVPNRAPPPGPAPITSPDGAPLLPATPRAEVLAAGDITGCDDEGPQTAEILDAHPAATVLTLGNNAYPAGTAQEYLRCYGPTWGRAKARTFPAPGDREYATTDATGYFGYFGSRAGPGYYSLDIGTWHLVSLDSEIAVDAASPQFQWLAADLAAHPAACTLAYWHTPRFSAATTAGAGDHPSLAPLYTLLYEHGVDVLLVAHDRNYQRFAPLDPAGAVDEPRGLRNFVVGTGGRAHDNDLGPHVGLQASDVLTSGVLALALGPADYTWTFLPIAGRTYTDAGTQACH